MYRNENGFDFISPAVQEAYMGWKSPGWEPAVGSRCQNLPMWERPDVLRTTTFKGASNLNFANPHVTFPASVISPSGRVSTDTTSRPTNVSLTDADKYHHNVQKIFALMSQFDTMTTDQVVAFTGLERNEVIRCLNILYIAEIVQKPSKTWGHYDPLGQLWRLDPYSYKTVAYPSGMDAVTHLCAFGPYSREDSPPPPGAGSRSAVKHNLFAAEMMLRIAESGDNVAGVWGDLFASESMFHEQDPQAKQRDSHGDCVVVTKDGTIIIIEVVGSILSSRGQYRTIVNKAASWVGVIANSPLDIRVIFVDTTWSEDKRAIINAVRLGASHVSEEYAPVNRTRERAMPKVGVVDGSWWFPDESTISVAATRLGAFVPYLHKFYAFDEPDPEFSTPELRRDVVINTVGALHTPPWIRGDIVDRNYRKLR